MQLSLIYFHVGMPDFKLLSQFSFMYCYNCLLNGMVLLLAEYGSLWGVVVFYWDEKLHSQKATQEEGSQNKNLLVAGISRLILQEGSLVDQYTHSSTSQDLASACLAPAQISPPSIVFVGVASVTWITHDLCMHIYCSLARH